MLEDLHIKNLALITEAHLQFGAGLTVLTGETGAGKTVLLSALKLAIGERADSDAIRRDADEASVSARFYFDRSGEELIVSRSVNQSGRSKASINDEMLTVKGLNERVGSHIDLHGQHDHQALLKPKTHLNLLDAYIGAELEPLRSDYHLKRAEYIQAKKQFESLRAQVALGAEEISLIELMLAEIDRVNPLDEEDTKLASELPSLVHAEEISSGAGQAWQSLNGEGGAYDLISAALARLSGVSVHHEGLGQAEERLKTLLIEVQDLGDTFKDISYSTEYDEAKLDHIQERLMQLDSLKKRFGPSLARVIEKRGELQNQLDHVHNADDELLVAEKQLSQVSEELKQVGATLQNLREQRALDFEESLRASVGDLSLENARFKLVFNELEFLNWSALGPAEAEILYSSSASSDVRPLAKIASGGELSRVMLGLKSILGASDSTEILVFDEIDAGIGGATALAVGQKLAALSQTHQILVVTHLAQVAAFGDAHFLVERHDSQEGTDTQVVPLSQEARLSELARMLSGATSQVALEHAQELFDLATQLKAAPIDKQP